jgi:hypothetical protein
MERNTTPFFRYTDEERMNMTRMVMIYTESIKSQYFYTYKTIQ